MKSVLSGPPIERVRTGEEEAAQTQKADGRLRRADRERAHAAAEHQRARAPQDFHDYLLGVDDVQRLLSPSSSAGCASIVSPQAGQISPPEVSAPHAGHSITAMASFLPEKSMSGKRDLLSRAGFSHTTREGETRLQFRRQMMSAPMPAHLWPALFARAHRVG